MVTKVHNVATSFESYERAATVPQDAAVVASVETNSADIARRRRWLALTT
jgi:hypothetical protein